MKKGYDTEIISVGTELLLGRVTNTDARDISRQLSRIGVNVRYHTVVGDNPERLRACVAIARERADILITTGGLGPTCDDLTRQIVCEAFGVPLAEDSEERQGLYDYIRGGKDITPNMFRQALIPEGGTVFHNEWGTAPGCAFEKDGKTVILLPGPPNECIPMLLHCAVPYLRRLGDGEIVSRTVCIFGIGESRVDDLFADEMNAMRNPSMAPYAKECDCLLQVTAKGADRAEAEAMIAPVIAHVCERLGDYVYGLDLDCLEEAVLPLLKERGLSFAAAESCTGGEVAKRFTDLPGASAVFVGGCVTYTNEAKTRLLGLDRDMIEANGAVSEPVARAMALAVREKTGADFGVSVTGLAGPEGDGVHPVGTVYVGLAAADGCWVRRLQLGEKRTRSFVRRMAGNHVFDMLRRYLTGLPVL